MIYSCNECKDKGKEFKVPADEIGIAIMKQHLKEHEKSSNECLHLSLKVVYMENEEGSVQLEICKKDNCYYIRTICEHKINEWIYTRNQENPEEQKLICKLCGADGT